MEVLETSRGTFKFIFDIPLLNNLFISSLNLFISLIELKSLLNNLFISYLHLLVFLMKLWGTIKRTHV